MRSGAPTDTRSPSLMPMAAGLRTAVLGTAAEAAPPTMGVGAADAAGALSVTVIFAGGQKRPKSGLHEKYRTPLTLPSFLPAAMP